MKLTVRVMIAGREIDQIECPPQDSSDPLLIRYRRRNWRVEEGCIHVDALPTIPMLPDAEAEIDILERLNLIASPLPNRLIDCTVLLRSEFPYLGDAAILAVATLAQLGMGLLAEETLLDFLDIHSAVSPLGNDPFVDSRVVPSTQLEVSASADTMIPTSDAEESDEWTLDWLPQQGWKAPEQDDTDLRSLAGQTQSQIGAHSVEDSGVYVIDFGELQDSDAWKVVIPETSQPARTQSSSDSPLGLLRESESSSSAPREQVSPRTSSLPAQHLSFIAEKTTLLGDTALEVLRYFADNPEDKSSHAESVTGYSRGVINGLLNGSLSRFVQKTSSGGWSCHSWVPDVLAVIDANR
ncbi:TPA: hypothetical protein ACG5DM_005930 [Pseudomonas putida]|uniref:hypothetical protein n=2 Tax=Pseudomonas putida TaxID=303 RepID=UPI001575E96B|nr:hypothetical protein [Pseudomonas putida]NTY91000.1 hypothetical protein [Pseudomonas putida]NTZ00964.1 hypothetical protein [Pseudomonas putida]NTZ22584.1 hypothetical protein [Pseudomonas putida]NTZ54467.1 hypothetical protein [Pseudomonas putida]NTZ67775.1 hypothetical protein [Pseudomonas putida]